MAPTTLIFLFCLGFTLSRGNVEEDITDIKDVLRKAMSEIEELKRDNALLKQEVREITPLRRKIHSLEVENSLLRHKYGNLAEEVKALRDVVGRECRRNNDSGVNGEVETSPSRPRIRMLSPDTSIATSNTIAFFVYRSTNEPNPSVHHTLIFDVIKLNLGNGYNPHTGIFSAPEDGLYAFSYGINCGVHGSLYFQFMKNGDILIDKRCDNDSSGDYREVSGTIIADLTSNDVVHISTKHACTTYIISYEDSRSFFGGWKIN